MAPDRVTSTGGARTVSPIYIEIQTQHPLLMRPRAAANAIARTEVPMVAEATIVAMAMAQAVYKARAANNKFEG